MFADVINVDDPYVRRPRPFKIVDDEQHSFAQSKHASYEAAFHATNEAASRSTTNLFTKEKFQDIVSKATI
jgi:hypothetical protein